MMNFLRSILVVVIGLAIGSITYIKWIRKSTQNQSITETNSLIVKKFLSAYKRPSHVVVQSFVKDPHSRFKKDIEEIKKLKIQKNEKSDYFIELQLFTDEADPTAPLVVQMRFLDKKTQNLIKEESINLN